MVRAIATLRLRRWLLCLSFPREFVLLIFFFNSKKSKEAGLLREFDVCLSVCHKTESVDWMDWLKLMGIIWKVIVTSTGQNWGKWQTLVGEKKSLFSIQKKNPENNGEVVNTWVFQAGSPRFDS